MRLWRAHGLIFNLFFFLDLSITVRAKGLFIHSLDVKVLRDPIPGNGKRALHVKGNLSLSIFWASPNFRCHQFNRNPLIGIFPIFKKTWYFVWQNLVFSMNQLVSNNVSEKCHLLHRIYQYANILFKIDIPTTAISPTYLRCVNLEDNWNANHNPSYQYQKTVCGSDKTVSSFSVTSTYLEIISIFFYYFLFFKKKIGIHTAHIKVTYLYYMALFLEFRNLKHLAPVCCAFVWNGDLS